MTQEIEGKLLPAVSMKSLYKRPTMLPAPTLKLLHRFAGYFLHLVRLECSSTF